MNTNPIKLCNGCAHSAYCVLTHAHSMVFSCTEFDELQFRAPAPILKIKIRKPELVTV